MRVALDLRAVHVTRHYRSNPESEGERHQSNTSDSAMVIVWGLKNSDRLDVTSATRNPGVSARGRSSRNLDNATRVYRTLRDVRFISRVRSPV